MTTEKPAVTVMLDMARERMREYHSANSFDEWLALFTQENNLFVLFTLLTDLLAIHEERHPFEEWEQNVVRKCQSIVGELELDESSLGDPYVSSDLEVGADEEYAVPSIQAFFWNTDGGQRYHIVFNSESFSVSAPDMRRCLEVRDINGEELLGRWGERAVTEVVGIEVDFDTLPQGIRDFTFRSVQQLLQQVQS